MIQEQVLLSESSVQSRIYGAGFKIDQRLFVVGGMSNNGKILDDFTEIDYESKKCREALVT